MGRLQVIMRDTMYLEASWVESISHFKAVFSEPSESQRLEKRLVGRQQQS